MVESGRLTPLLDVLRDLIRWLDAASVSGVIIGGVAASLLGRPRATRDVDVLVLLDDEAWAGFLDVGKKFGFVPRLTDVLDFAHRSRMLLVRHEVSGIDADIAFGALAFEEEAIRRAVPTDIAGVRLPLPTTEDLIIMKAVAHRPRDVTDIEALLDANPTVDLGRIRKWVKEFDVALDTSELSEALEGIIAARH